jgi:DNA polymerase zeta
VRLGHYASEVYMPLSAIVASKRMARDPATAPKQKERVPYIVLYGPPGARLMDKVVEPTVLLGAFGGNSSGAGNAGSSNVPAPYLQIDGRYYITKVVNPALDRVLSLCGADVKHWYFEMPRPRRRCVN